MEEIKDYKKGIVVLLDFLGVSSLTKEESVMFIAKRNIVVDTIKKECEVANPEKMKILIEGLMRLKDEKPSIDSEKVLKEFFFNITQLLRYLNNEIVIRTFGDSILITWYPKNSDMNNSMTVSLFLFAIANVLKKAFIVGLKNEILLRGAVSVGDFLESSSNDKDLTVIGPAITDVKDWYEQANWAGIIATPHAGIFIDLYDIDNDIKLFANLYFVKYSVPLKTNALDKDTKFWVISWVANDELAKTWTGALSDIYKLMTKFHIPFGVEDKYFNTIKFAEWCLIDFYPKFTNSFKTL